MKKFLSLLVCLVIHTHSGATQRDPDTEAEAQKFVTMCPHLKNIGLIMCGNSTLRTAIQLTPQYVLTSGASDSVQSPEKSIFIQARTYDIPMTGTDLDLDLTMRDLKKAGVPFSSFKVIYKPLKMIEIQQVVMASDIANCKSYMEHSIKKLSDLKLFLETIGNEFPLLGRDIALLQLETHLPVKNLPLRAFSSPEMSEMNSICIGAQAKVVPTTRKKKVCRVSLTAFVQKSTYDKTCNIFYNSFETRGGVPETFSSEKLPEKDKLTGLIGCETLGAPLFFTSDNKQWTLGGIMSNGYTTERLKSFVEEVAQSKDESVRRNTRSVKKLYEELMKEMVPVYNISTSLEWVVGKIIRAGINETAEDLHAKEFAAQLVTGGLETEAAPNMSLLRLMAPTEQENEALRNKAEKNRKKRLAKKKKEKNPDATSVLPSSEGLENEASLTATLSELAGDKSETDKTIGLIKEEAGSITE